MRVGIVLLHCLFRPDQNNEKVYVQYLELPATPVMDTQARFNCGLEWIKQTTSINLGQNQKVINKRP